MTMQYGRITGLDKDISRLAQGCMMLSDADEQSIQDSFAILDAAAATGINCFDNGHIYGGGACDRTFGLWVKARGNRDQVVILSKGCHHNADGKRVTAEAIRSDIADSLERMQVEHFDIWMFHRDDPSVPVGPLVEALHEEVQAGRITCIGGSNWTTERIAEFNAYADAHGMQRMLCSSPNFSLADQIDSPWGSDCITISGPKHAADRAWYADNQVPVFSWSSLARGFMTGRLTRANFEAEKDNFEEHTIRCYVCEDNWQRLERCEELGKQKGLSIAQMALAFVLNQEFPTFALVGSRNAEEANANIEALGCKLSQDEIAYLDLKAASVAS